MTPSMRLHPRLVIRLAAAYRLPAANDWVTAAIRDLSAGGVGLLTPAPLPLETVLSPLRFELPGDDGAPGHEVRVDGLVLRSDSVPGSAEGSRYRSGVLFLDLRGERYERVRRFVFQRLRLVTPPDSPAPG